MAYGVSEARVGVQEISTTSTVQQHPLGTRIKAVDPVYGDGEFIYLKGVVGTDVGEMVVYDQNANTTVLTVAGSRGPCAVSMSANVANQYGWYQIAGAAITKAAASAANASVYVTATAGTVDDAVVATDKIDGARFKTADGTPSAGFAIVQLDRPSLNGNG
jgi:hypothetical protein